MFTDPMTGLPTVDTPRVPVTTTYHGTDVTEEYRWLEDGSSDATASWTGAQQQRTAAYLESVPWWDRSERASSSC